MTYYDEISSGYEQLHREEQKNKRLLIQDTIKPKTSDKLLDVGCGSGVSSEDWDCEVYGIDTSEKLIEQATKKKIGTFQVSAGENIPFSDNEFDIVISLTAIHNFTRPDKAIEEMKRVSKKGSLIAITCLKSRSLEFIEKSVRSNLKVIKEMDETFDKIWICENEK